MLENGSWTRMLVGNGWSRSAHGREFDGPFGLRPLGDDADGRHFRSFELAAAFAGYGTEPLVRIVEDWLFARGSFLRFAGAQPSEQHVPVAYALAHPAHGPRQTEDGRAGHLTYFRGSAIVRVSVE